MEKLVKVCDNKNQELENLILGIIDKISSKKTSRYKKFKEIAPLVDYLQENNHPLAKSFVALFEVFHCVEKIRKLRRELRNIPKANYGKTYYYEDKKLYMEDYFKSIEKTFISAENLDVNILIEALMGLLNVPSTVSI